MTLTMRLSDYVNRRDNNRLSEIKRRLGRLQAELKHVENTMDSPEKDPVEYDRVNKEIGKLSKKIVKLKNKEHKLSVKITSRDMKSSPIVAPVLKDEELNYNRESEAGLIARNKAKSKLTEEFVRLYIKRLEKKESLKVWFFRITMTLFVLFLVSSFALIFITGKNVLYMNLESWEFIIACVTVMGGIVSSLLILPKIIGKYLYDKNENKEITKLLKHVFSDDRYASDTMLSNSKKSETDENDTSLAQISIKDTQVISEEDILAIKEAIINNA